MQGRADVGDVLTAETLGSLARDEDDFVCVDALVRQTSCPRVKVRRPCLRGVRLRSTLDPQSLSEVSRMYTNLNRLGGLLKLAIRGEKARGRRSLPRDQVIGHRLVSRQRRRVDE